jgi:hypothetical protein
MKKNGVRTVKELEAECVMGDGNSMDYCVWNMVG